MFTLHPNLGGKAELSNREGQIKKQEEGIARVEKLTTLFTTF